MDIVGGEALDFFLNSPNSYLKGKAPMDLLATDLNKVLSLAKAFANPSEPF